MMHPTITEPSIVVEPINQTPTQLDFADWLPWQFPGVVTPSAGPAESARLPVIEW
jgi:hypothetical protein